MPAANRLSTVTLCLALAACGGNQGASSGPDGGTGAYKLALVGSAVLTVHPGDKRALQVVLAQDQVGPVSGTLIQFDFQDGDPAGAALETTAGVQTAADGTATVHFTAGLKTATYKLVASVPSYPEVTPVAFSFNVVPVRRLLQIVGHAPDVTVASDGASATVLAGLSSSQSLRVKELDQDTGNAIAGDTITFSLPSQTTSNFSGQHTTTALTGSSGEAQVFLLTTAAHESPFALVAQSGQSGVTVSFNVNVQASTTGAGCSSNSECNNGQICVGGKCQDGSGGTGCGAGSDQPCPYGYECQSGICTQPSGSSCDPRNPKCPSGDECICTPVGSSACACQPICPVCPTGTVCDPSTRQCGPLSSDTPDVTGVWQTRHTFSIQKALPSVLTDIFKALRILDQLVSGQLGLPSWLNDIIKAIINQYIPSWVITIIQIGDDIGTILTYLRSEGAMRIGAGADATHVKGTEVWSSLVFYWLPLCNGQIAGSIDDPPECARLDVATTDSSNPGEVGQCKGQTIPAVTVQVAPFTGNVSGKKTTFAMNFDHRGVKLEMGKVVLAVIDELLALTTPWNCIDEATDCAGGNPCIVDCVGVGNFADGIISGTGETVTQLCDGAVTVLGQQLTKILATITFKTDLIDFTGHASISRVGVDNSACDSMSNCAGQLGVETYDHDLRHNPDTRDGYWEGSFFYDVIPNMPGAFNARRPQ